MKHTIILSAPYMMSSVERFRKVIEGYYGINMIVPEVKQKLTEDQIISYAGQFDGTICGDDVYSARVIEACVPRLKVISKWGTGIDAIDKEAATRLGVVVGNTLNAFTIPVSETAIGYMLSFFRAIPFMDDSMREGIWNKPSTTTLSENTIGIVGVGNIGQAVVRRLRAFGCRILVNDIAEIKPDFLIENRIESVSLPELLSRSDIVTMHTDLNPTCYHLINRETLAMMKPTAILINTSRGPIVDEAALAEALENGKLGGAALDVFEVEPLPDDSPLRKFKNVLLAPHNSNYSPMACERVHWNTIRNCLIPLGYDVSKLEELKKTI
ncbi:MAG TPA: phosphoglycerate dehydrogenase [Flexilinea sp.]|nr:phosphoglycerate dehydrogenase [Flexilinea sp.]